MNDKNKDADLGLSGDGFSSKWSQVRASLKAQEDIYTIGGYLYFTVQGPAFGNHKYSSQSVAFFKKSFIRTPIIYTFSLTAGKYPIGCNQPTTLILAP